MIETTGPIHIKAIENPHWRERLKTKTSPQKGLEPYTMERAKRVREFYSTLSEYHPTPLVNLSALAHKLGTGGIYVKDESHRFGLNAFKGLGAPYAIAMYICEKLGMDIEEVSFEYLKSQEIRDRIGQITFSTATDGNHGRAVAWAAQQLGQKAVVFLPKGSAESRVEAIRKTGAQVYVTDYHYDETVELAAIKARENDWQIIQDTAWEGYQVIPHWIMEGYTSLIDEALDQLNSLGIERPTHVFLQAGVGSMAAAVQGYLVNRYGADCPYTVIMEPHEAACIFESALSGDGKAQPAKGSLNTMMAGLSCGVPNPLAWEIMRDYSSLYVSCPDYVSAYGTRILANPLEDDGRIISGESGAVGTGLLAMLLQEEGCREIKEISGLNKNSRILLFSTEGDTDPENYREIVWKGKYPIPI